MTVFFVKV